MARSQESCILHALGGNFRTVRMRDRGGLRNSTGAQREAPVPGQRPSCKVDTSQQNCSIASSTFYTTRETRSRAAASFPNRGSRALGNTFSPTSPSTPPRNYNRGKPPFRIPPRLPRVIPGLCLSSFLGQLHPRMQKRAAGFQLFLASCPWR